MSRLSLRPTQQRTANWLFLLALLMLVVSIALLIFVGRIVLQVRSEAAALETVNVMLTLENTDAEGQPVTLDDFFAVAGQIEAAEGRAISFLGVFEAIAFVVSVLGLVVVGLGIFAAVIGVGNYSSLLNQLEEASEKLQASQSVLDSLQTGREQIMQELSGSIQQEWRTAHLALSLLPLAERQYKSGNVYGALETYNRAAELDPSNPVSFYYVGYIHTQRNNLTEAESALTSALTLDPRFYHAVAALGYTYRRIGETAEDINEKNRYFRNAESYLKQALAADERLVDADGESWYGSLAGLYRRMGRVDDAIYHYEQAAKITPQSSYPAVNLALMSLREGRDDVSRRFERVQDLAIRKIRAELEAYWGYADLLVAELALGSENALNTVNYFLEILPPSVHDVIPRVVDAVQTILVAPPYPDDSRHLAHIQSVLEQLQGHQQTNI
jgi:tetratricopeptide (TPR) repeat protein